MRNPQPDRIGLTADLASATVVFLVIFGLSVIGALFYARAAREDARANATALASELRARCDNELNSVVYLSSGLNAYFAVHSAHLEDGQIEQMLGQLYASSRHVRNFGVAVGYVLRYVYPLKGNESAIGLDYRKLPAQLPAVQAAIDSRKPTLSPRISLVQGGEGVIYRSPIFVQGQYWGLLSTVIDIDDLLRSSFSSLDGTNQDIAVRQADNSRELLWGNPAVFDAADSASLVTRFGWEIAVRPEPRSGAKVVTISLGLAGAFLGFLVSGSLFSALRSRRALRTTSALKTAILGAANVSIVAVTPAGVITLFNRAAERMLGYRADEMIGRRTPALFHDRDEMIARAAALSRELGRRIEPGLEAYVAKARTGAADEARWTYVRKDGSRFPVILSVTAIRDEAGGITGFLGIASDVTERDRQERAIREALGEKETLLKEVYHRVKNNLQVITSLFNLQARSLPAGAARDALREGAERVRAMALVHEKLYQSSTLSSISIEDYVNALCRDLAAANGAAERGIGITTRIEPIQIGLETAVPLGLLMNELISNSLKHGFPEARRGEIRIQIRPEGEGRGILEISDNGVGYPDEAIAGRSNSLGLRLIQTLSRQLDGTLTLANGGGACARLEFRLSEPVQPGR